MSDDTGPDAGIEAERAALGACMLSATALEAVADTITVDDLAHGAHKDVYEAILALREEGAPVDAVTVRERLHRTGTLGRIGGAGYLLELTEAVANTGSAGYHANIVREHATLRRLAVAGSRIMGMGRQTDGSDLDDITVEAQTELDKALAHHRGVVVSQSVGELLAPTLDRLETAVTPGIPTGFHDLDHMYAGHHPGALIVVGARPHVGKTLFGLTLGRNAADAGHPGMVLSLEMSSDQLMERLVSSEARVSLDRITKHELTEEDWARISRVADRIDRMPLHLVDTAGSLTLGDVRAHIRRAQRDHGVKIVVIDYLQLMTPPKANNREQEVAALSRGLKLLAMELGVAIVLLAQLNRGSEQRANKTPVMSDLRESGAIEQDADVVFLLHREDQYERESPRAGEADVIVAKNRYGHTGTVVVACQGHYARFVSISADPVSVSAGAVA